MDDSMIDALSLHTLPGSLLLVPKTRWLTASSSSKESNKATKISRRLQFAHHNQLLEHLSIQHFTDAWMDLPTALHGWCVLGKATSREIAQHGLNTKLGPIWQMWKPESCHGWRPSVHLQLKRTL